ncbi:hypothetical protein [Photobacterium sanguinicancri]|uniref:Uncharacterized protein n=1 Tax=Photobacterium sanguinicancri TaxID=875932 RepID=A0AAW7Y674_9GAMM|nr:hypothetical protein [Photobacterium sanguinicancri]MDO6543877.1 hypothetical protein [Photobacterium sanguinicancri]
MQSDNYDLLLEISAFLFFIGCIGIFIWVAIVVYLKNKWMLLLEDNLDNGVRFYSLNVFLSIQGVLHYSTVFLSKYQAKRYGMDKKIKTIPLGVQRKFIFSFALFMFSSFLMGLSVFITEVILV